VTLTNRKDIGILKGKDLTAISGQLSLEENMDLKQERLRVNEWI
jgi:hypothetical protein